MCKRNIVRAFSLFVVLALGFAACGPSARTRGEWTAKQKKQWLDTCLVLTGKYQKLDSASVKKKQEFCACMLEVTVRDYSPKQAFAQSEEEVIRRFAICDFKK
ncbi:hypothetical protein FUAX_15650 [Fulvitalea axinellae]|uniref:Lipoprotein n=1 Tax=Fulvitalea axinellae TaxID=1182444 RepID=A0AAU9CGI1_9BACT|nr:hypothetical protein FUAX_15650 [Fulvitalea axinellae]